MRIVRGEIHELRIPFRFAVSHARKTRRYSDSVVVSVTSESGSTGYGEALARPYVTGETPEGCCALLEDHLLPAILRLSLPSSPAEPGALFRWIHDAISESMADVPKSGVIALNAARCALELALIDLWLREHGLSLSSLIPPRRTVVQYSGVIPASSRRRALALALAFRAMGVSSLKLKVRRVEDAAGVRAVRHAVGSLVSLRVDANTGLALDDAVSLGTSLAAVGVEAFEQPTPRSETRHWGRLTAASRIPVMADESLVTTADARRLLALRFPKLFNLRLAKLGGIYPTLRIAGLARRYGVRCQLGCLVGETAILSAAGRTVAAHSDPLWVEGSFGTWLLEKDVSKTPVRFGLGGRGKVLEGAGLGIEVSATALARYRARRVALER